MNFPFKTIYPTSSLLKKHIYCFYCYQSDDPISHSVHYSLPHIYNAVSIYSNARIALEHKSLKAFGDSCMSLSCIIQGKQQAMVRAELNGKFKRITIIFKPLGLNQFIKCRLHKVMGKESSVFKEWESDNFQDVLSAVFSNPNFGKSLDELENFLCDVYECKNLPQIEQAIQLLEAFNPCLAVSKIAHNIGLPLRSFNRLFKSHIGVSPITYRRIFQFRKSLESKLFKDKMESFTTLSLRNGFYDQSAFIKLFRLCTGASPKMLLKNLYYLRDSKLVFHYPDSEKPE